LGASSWTFDYLEKTFTASLKRGPRMLDILFLNLVSLLQTRSSLATSIITGKFNVLQLFKVGIKLI